ncbi:MAG: PspC domain-containing protein [Clostridia bacterium]|nr:PspC domain-containing protein [Clostridia bacterium]
MKKLYRSETDKKLCGVLGGLAKYLEIDATVLRIVYVLLSLFVLGCPVIIYLIAVLIIPKEPQIPQEQQNNNYYTAE